MHRDAIRLTLANKIVALEKEVKQLRSLLNPRTWSKETHDKWHQKLPDVQAAFDSLLDE